MSSALSQTTQPPAPGGKAWLDAVRAELASAWQDMGRGELQQCEVIRRIDCAFSRIHFLRVVSEAGVDQLVAKSTVRDPMNRPFWEHQVQAKVEFEILQHLHPQFADQADLAVPRPVCVSSDLDTYVMEFVDGAPLVDGHAALRRFTSRRPFQVLADDYERFGRWLAHFQKVTKPDLGDASHLEGIAERIRLRLRRIADAQDARVPAGFRDAVEARLERLLKSTAKSPIPIAGRHGDFGAWNAMTAGSGQTRGLVVFDFMGYAREPRPLDAINVIHFLVHEAHNMLTSHRRVRELITRFLRGFRPSRISADVYSRPLVTLCEMHARVYGVWGAISTPAQKPHHRLQQSAGMKENTAWLVKENALCLWERLS